MGSGGPARLIQPVLPLVPLRFCPTKVGDATCGLCVRRRSLRTGWSPVTGGVNVEAALEDEGGDFGRVSSLTGINVRGSAAASSLACSLILSPRFRPSLLHLPPMCKSSHASPGAI